jgi:hypothetical protein
LDATSDYDRTQSQLGQADDEKQPESAGGQRHFPGFGLSAGV